MKTKQILFPVISLKAGVYHPAEFQPQNLMVAVDVPLDDEHFANASDLQDDSQPPQTPILTVAGLRWCYNKLQSAFVTEPDTKSATSDDDDSWE